MDARVVARFESTLPADDDHPYRTGPWRPNVTEWHARDCDVIGELPADLNGVYLRNTENPLHPALGRYHPFDGDGMIHAVEFGNGSAAYRNRFIRTAGFEAELAVGGPLWAGLAEPPSRSLRDGWGARTRMKDASSTDVVVHAGRGLDELLPVRRPVRQRPADARAARRRAAGTVGFPGVGVSAHPKVDPATGELLFFNYSTTAPYLNFGVVDAANDGRPLHADRTSRPAPPARHGVHRELRHPQRLPAVLGCRTAGAAASTPCGSTLTCPPASVSSPAAASNDDIRWFEASPTYVLHWINAFEDGDEVVVDGFFERNPEATIDPAAAVAVAWPRRRRAVDVPVPRRHRARSGSLPLAPRPAHRGGQGGGPLRRRQ